MNVRMKNPGRAVAGADRGTQNEHPPPQEANVPTAYLTDPLPLLHALAHPDVATSVTHDAPHGGPCTWCQEYGHTAESALYWIPRADVLSDGYAECCLSCLPERIRRAVDDSQLGARVRVEIDGGAA